MWPGVLPQNGRDYGSQLYNQHTNNNIKIKMKNKTK